MHIPIADGRPFTDRDNDQARTMRLIKQLLGNFSGENPVGKRIGFGNAVGTGQPILIEILGVIANVRSTELKEEAEAELYFSSLQSPFESMSLVV